MRITLLRVGPVDDWVRTIAHHLQVDPVLVTTQREDLDAALDRLDGEPVILSADVVGLNAVVLRLVRREQVEQIPVGWVADMDKASRELSGWLGLPARPTLAADLAAAEETHAVRMVRDDHGGVLLHRGRLSAYSGGAGFGAQSYHDDTLAANGTVRRIDVRPDYTVDCALVAEVVTGRPLRRPSRSTGRSLQTACDEAVSTVDGVAHPRPVTKWTWYADPRQHWLLRAPAPRG